MKIKNWTACIQDREKLKEEVVERANLSAIKGSSVPGGGGGGGEIGEGKEGGEGEGVVVVVVV
jgi:hypothetical protein